MIPVSPYTLQGKIIVRIIRSLLFFIYVFRGTKWERPRKNFIEDPLHYNWVDIIYFSYKYYYKPPELPEGMLQINSEFIPPVLDYDTPVISISAGGDLMPYAWINEKYCTRLWDDIGADFFGNDIVIANLETPVDSFQSVGLVPEVMLNHMEFNCDESMFDIFNGNKKYKGFDILSTANNHSFDKGETGIINTIAFLQKQNIRHSGTASSWEQQNNFPILERNGIKVAFIAFTYSLNHLEVPLGKEYLCTHIPLNKPGCDLSFIKKQVIIAHERGADIVVASVHYGNAYQLFPGEHIIEISHRLFDECGIDILLGGHAHNIQPVEFYPFTCPVTLRKKQGFVTYCMGDFVAYDIFTWGHLPVWFRIDIGMSAEGAVIKEIFINPVYTSGNYINKNQRDLRFLNAKKLWKQIENNNINTLESIDIKEALYLRSIYEKVFGKLELTA